MSDRPARVPPATALMAQDFEDRPYLGASYGEMLPVAPPEPPAAWEPFTVPPWPESERRREAAQAQAAEEPQQPAMTAVEAMMANAAELGELEEPEPLGPPALPAAPLERPVFPEPDWELEERLAHEENARARREHALHVLRDLGIDPNKSLQRRPA